MMTLLDSLPARASLKRPLIHLRATSQNAAPARIRHEESRKDLRGGGHSLSGMQFYFLVSTQRCTHQQIHFTQHSHHSPHFIIFIIIIKQEQQSSASPIARSKKDIPYLHLYLQYNTSNLKTSLPHTFLFADCRSAELQRQSSSMVADGVSFSKPKTSCSNQLLKYDVDIDSKKLTTR